MIQCYIYNIYIQHPFNKKNKQKTLNNYTILYNTITNLGLFKTTFWEWKENDSLAAAALMSLPPRSRLKVFMLIPLKDVGTVTPVPALIVEPSDLSCLSIRRFGWFRAPPASICDSTCSQNQIVVFQHDPCSQTSKFAMSPIWCSDKWSWSLQRFEHRIAPSLPLVLIRYKVKWTVRCVNTTGTSNRLRSFLGQREISYQNLPSDWLSEVRMPVALGWRCWDSRAHLAVQGNLSLLSQKTSSPWDFPGVGNLLALGPYRSFQWARHPDTNCWGWHSDTQRIANFIHVKGPLPTF